MSHPETQLTCRRALVLLEAYLDGDLAPVRRVAMDAHLAGCHTCARELMRARQVRTALRELLPQALSSAALEAVRARAGAGDANGADRGPQVQLVPPVPEPGWGSRGRDWWRSRAVGWRPAMVAASIAVVAFGGYLALHHPQQDKVVTPEDVRRADAQVRWVLARLGQINDHAAQQVRTEVFEKRVADPAMRAVNGALENSVTQ